jgi:hypothetical protein
MNPPPFWPSTTASSTRFWRKSAQFPADRSDPSPPSPGPKGPEAGEGFLSAAEVLGQFEFPLSAQCGRSAAVRRLLEPAIKATVWVDNHGPSAAARLFERLFPSVLPPKARLGWLSCEPSHTAFGQYLGTAGHKGPAFVPLTLTVTHGAGPCRRFPLLRSGRSRALKVLDCAGRPSVPLFGPFRNATHGSSTPDIERRRPRSHRA